MEFSAGLRLCRLLNATRHSVRHLPDYFKVDADWDLYESACLQRNQRSSMKGREGKGWGGIVGDLRGAGECLFLRAKGEGLVSIYDELIPNVASVRPLVRALALLLISRLPYQGEDCEGLCLAWEAGLCRSYTFDERKGTCLLG